MVRLRARVVSARKRASTNEDDHREGFITARPRNSYQTQRGHDRSHRVPELERVLWRDVAVHDQPISEGRAENAEDPGRKVGKRRPDRVLFDVQVEDVRHVGGELCELRVENRALPTLERKINRSVGYRE